MLKAATGFSLLRDSRKAGAEAAAMIQDMLKDIKLVFVYFSVGHDPWALWKGLTDRLPGTPLIGCSSWRGVITPDGFIGGEAYVALMGLDDPGLSAAVGLGRRPEMGSSSSAPEPSKSPQAGAQAAENALAKAGRPESSPCFFYLASTPGAEEEHLSRLVSSLGPLPFAGSTAYGPRSQARPMVLSDDGPAADGLAVALFYGDKSPATHYASPYRETGFSGLITRMKGTRQVLEIDNLPALKVMAEYLKCPACLLKGGDLSLATALSPLGLKTDDDELLSVCHPLYGYGDGSIYCGSALCEGLTVCGLTCTPDELIKGCGRELENLQQKLRGPAGAYHMSINHTWPIVAEKRLDELVGGLKSAAGPAPFICALTDGEHGGQNGGVCGSLAASYTAFPQ